MPLSHIEHFLVQTEDMEKTKNWYVDVLGMQVGPHPDFKFPVCWLYLGDEPVVHIAEGGKGVSENRKKYLGAAIRRYLWLRRSGPYRFSGDWS